MRHSSEQRQGAFLIKALLRWHGWQDGGLDDQDGACSYWSGRYPAASLAIDHAPHCQSSVNVGQLTWYFGCFDRIRAQLADALNGTALAPPGSLTEEQHTKLPAK